MGRAMLKDVFVIRESRERDALRKRWPEVQRLMRRLQGDDDLVPGEHQREFSLLNVNDLEGPEPDGEGHPCFTIGSFYIYVGTPAELAAWELGSSDNESVLPERDGQQIAVVMV